MRLRLKIPSVEPDVYPALPEHCPACNSTTWQGHGRPVKAIRDTRRAQVLARRIQCTECGATMRIYPIGVSQRKQSERLRGLTILLYLLGLSYRAVADVVVAALGTSLGHTTVYNNVQHAGEGVRQLKQRRLASIRVRVLAVDGTYVKVNGQHTVLLYLGDGEKGLCLAIEIVPAEDTDSLDELIGEMAQAVGAEILLSDDLDAYKSVADRQGLAQQICNQHVVPNTLRKLAQIADQLGKRYEQAEGQGAARSKIEQAIEHILELEQIILWRSPGSQKRLDELVRVYEKEPSPKKGQRASPFCRLKLLCLHLAANWPRLTLNEVLRGEDGRKFIPRTNNVSEQSIGMNIKERYRTMRGYKSERSVLRVTTLTAFLRDEGDDQALIRALAA
jgi:transposase-like protein